MELSVHSLPNGIRIVHQQTTSAVAHCALFMDTGSRDESSAEWGYAHFVEHILFKGTKKRNAYHILSRMEDVGGELNAFTTKEETCLHTSFLPRHLPRAMELLSDMVFHHQFTERSLASEREVILDEINSCKDNPSDLIFDEFDQGVFPGHPLGHPILGTRHTLRTLNREKILSFIARHYTTDRMVFASVGPVPFRSVLHYAGRFLATIPPRTGAPPRERFTGYQPFFKEVRKHTHQVHCLLGSPGYDQHHPNRYGLFLLTNLLGGPGMNTRLNMALRERNGFSYNVEASYTPFTDTGICTLYFSTDKERLERSRDIVFKELHKLREQPLGTLQLSKAKQQLTGQLAIGYESLEHQMLSIGKSMLVFGNVEPMCEVYRKINEISSGQLIGIARDIFRQDALSQLIYQ